MYIDIGGSPNLLFTVITAERLLEDRPPPPLSFGLLNEPLGNISVLCIDIPPGDHTAAVTFSPMWEDSGDVRTFS